MSGTFTVLSIRITKKQLLYLLLQNFGQKPLALEQKLLDCLSEGTVLLGEISGKGEIESYGTVVIRRDLYRN